LFDGDDNDDGARDKRLLDYFEYFWCCRHLDLGEEFISLSLLLPMEMGGFSKLKIIHASRVF
jgi:hypothetical protein